MLLTILTSLPLTSLTRSLDRIEDALALGAGSRRQARLPDHDVSAKLLCSELARRRDDSDALLLRGEHSSTVPRALLALLPDDRD